MMLQIRNMVSSRCITLVKNELDELGIKYKKIELGRVEFKDSIAHTKLKLFNSSLKKSGLELISDKKSCLVEKIKSAINVLVYLSDDQPKQIFSEFISNKVNYDYTYLSNLFSEEEGITIEKYISKQKIERVKELIVYENISLNDIAFKLQYSSVSHLSNQFKKMTGLTPSFYRKLQKVRHIIS
jgi:YesN/AraC family two-component response regulator